MLYTPEGFVGTKPCRQPNTCSSLSCTCACIRIRRDYFSLLRPPQDKEEEVNVHGAAEAGGGGGAGMGLTGTFDACADPYRRRIRQKIYVFQEWRSDSSRH